MWFVSINRSRPGSPFTFLDLLNLQNQVLARAQNDPAWNFRGALLFAEMDSVVTLGRKQELADETAQDEFINSLRQHLAQKKIMLVAGERGGNETWHGPGQWVCFIVTPLADWAGGDTVGVRKAICKILNCVLPVVQEYIPAARVDEDERLGIWASGDATAGKVVSIGIKIQKRWITSGFAINAFPTETSFYGINPCGLPVKADFLFQGRVPEAKWEAEFEALPAKLVKALS